MNRRDFLKMSSLGIVGLSLPSLTACNNNKKIDAPVLVIGAGIAGLGAARALKGAGFTNIIVLEARNRVGGRIWTDRSFGFPVDLGASWIHGMKGGNPIPVLADNAGAGTYITDDEKLTVYNTNGAKIDGGTIDSYYKDYQSMLKSIENNGTAGQSLKTAIQNYNGGYLNDNIMKYQLASYAEFDAGGAIEDLDAAYWQNDNKFPGKDAIISNGYDTLPALLAQTLDVRLNATVTKISYDSNGVQVTTNQGNFSAKYLICTLPLGVLKAGSVTFSPALPADKQNAIQRLKMGSLNKVALTFPSAFWEQDQQYIGYCPDTKGQYSYFLNGKKFTDRNLLITFGFGNYAQVMEGQSDNQIKSDVTDILRKMYGNAIPAPSQVVISRWASDPFARGAYSMMNVGASLSDFDSFVPSVENKLFFAGEHTNGLYRGTTHGAYISGLRQAEKLIDLED